MDKITVTQIQEHREQIRKLSETSDQVRKRRDQEVSRLKWDVYKKEIDAISRKRDEAIDKTTQKYDGIVTDITSQIQEQSRIVNHAKRILEFLKLDTPKDLAIPDDDIELSQYVESCQESLGYFYDDDYLKIKAFIISNRKPKNKFSLIVVGKSIFPKEIIEYPYSYGMNISNHSRYFSLQQVIKDGDSVSDLKGYYNKRKDAILKETIIEYERVKTEYAEVRQNYAVAEFSELITWQCPKCDNFNTIFDDFSVNYTPQCFRHEPYIAMVKNPV